MKPPVLPPFRYSEPKQIIKNIITKQQKVDIQKQCMFTAQFYPNERNLYTDNIRAPVTKSMSTTTYV